MISKERFIKLVEKKNVEEQLTYSGCVKAVRKKTLGADGISIALTILDLRKDIKSLQPRNRRSTKKLIKWLKSEMRWYADYGSFDVLVGVIVNHYYECLRDRKRKELDEKRKESLNGTTKNT